MTIKILLVPSALVILACPPLRAAPYQTPVPARFDGADSDRKAIEALLDMYTKAASTKDESLFETLSQGGL